MKLWYTRRSEEREEVGDLSRQQLANFFTLYANNLAIMGLVSGVAAKKGEKKITE
jgi:hypothetical protein